MRCVLAFLTFSSLLSALVDAYGLDEMQISKLPQETVSALSKLSPGPVSHSMTFQESLVGSWRGDISLLEDYETNLATASPSHQGLKSDVGRELSTPSFSCQRMNDTFNPYFMCSDVVDYDYYLPAGSTLDDLEETVRASVPAAFGIMTGECLSDFKKMMCARVFPPCVDNGKSLHFRVYPSDSMRLHGPRVWSVCLVYLCMCAPLMRA